MEKWLQDKKTYIVAGIGLAAALGTWSQEYIGGDTALVMSTIAVLAATLKAAIMKGPKENRPS